MLPPAAMILTCCKWNKVKVNSQVGPILTLIGIADIAGICTGALATRSAIYVDDALSISKRQVLLEATIVEVVLNNQYKQGWIGRFLILWPKTGLGFIKALFPAGRRRRCNF